MKLLVSDPLSEEGLKILAASGIPVDVKPGLGEDELCAIIGGYDGLIIRSGTKVTKRVIEAGSKLRVIGRAGVGVDNIDIPAATEKGILVMNTPTANILSAAEHSCAMIMALARNIPMAHASMHRGEWKRSKYTGIELNGKTLGIIGVGRVGGEVARRLKHFNMKLIGYDPFLPKEVADDIGVRLTTLEEVLRTSDVMTIHTPLLPDTRGMIAMPQFEMMKPTALLVNVARGGIVDEADLYEALKKKVIAGAAFDVWEHEPLDDAERRLLELDNLVTTPHLGASTLEAQERVSVDVAEAAIKFLKDGIITNAINAPRGQLPPELAPYLPLAEDLGIVAHQIHGARPIDTLDIVCSGEISKKDTRMVATSAVIGVLRNIIGEKANMINAAPIAKSKGINITEGKNEDSEVYDNMLTVRIGSGRDATEVRGTVFAHKPRIIGVNEYSFEMPVSDYVLVSQYRDEPGVIGAVGGIIGGAGINIGQMTVGRDEPRGTALMVFSVDHPVPPELVAKIDDATGLRNTKFICLGRRVLRWA